MMEWYEPALEKMEKVIPDSPSPDIGQAVLTLFKEQPSYVLTRVLIDRNLDHPLESSINELDWLHGNSCLKKIEVYGYLFYFLKGEPDRSFMGSVLDMAQS